MKTFFPARAADVHKLQERSRTAGPRRSSPTPAPSKPVRISHPQYTLPGMQSVPGASPHGPSPSVPGSNTGPPQQREAQGPPPGPTQPAQQGMAQSQRPGPQNAGPQQPPNIMQTSSAAGQTQMPLLTAQGPHPSQQQSQQQQQGPAGTLHHPMSSLPVGHPQQADSRLPQHQQSNSVSQAQGQAQQAAASMPPSAAGPGSGPGGPILNGAHGHLNVKDALSYLDQVKFQFQDQPDVYNKFLDIMKDFKSQAIDTPGVIDRVSTLFSGHPSLIQGFNTFLPPGYRIECSQDPRDTKITVTTPSGIHHAASGGEVSIGGDRSGMQLNTASLSVAVSGANGPGQGQHSIFYEQQVSRWDTPYAHGLYGPQGGAGGAQQSQPPQQQSEPLSAHQLHQQQIVQAQVAQQQQAQHQASVQQGVNQLQSAVAHTNGSGVKGPVGLVVGGPGTPTAGVNDPKSGKGPVEFNHAISYVNKIKNRFAQQPEIYKNFLEILQTYQRESKPIQDVYSQVTQLFHSAPDLLEDFKQFLPESAAQARAAAAAKAAADEAAGHTGHIGPSGPSGPGGAPGTSRLPPVGNFAPPPSVGKENKKKRGAQGLSTVQEPKTENNSANGTSNALRSNKRHKVGHPAKPSVAEQLVAVSPTLIPFHPEPLGPQPQPMATTEELAFFDRVKKFIGNKQTYNEFLKLLNLFSHDLIAKDMLVDKVSNFISGNKELMDWFKRFVGYDGKADDLIDNAPSTVNKVRLNLCRGLGPSYRLLPKLEAQKPCSGRDEMCWEVLNDQWASHPTWASEDSGFVAHKKNQYEDILHRIEEERHDYDFNIEANSRTIQLLEPIAQRIANMTPEEKVNFRLAPGLGGQSKTIYQRIIKKVYDKEKGLEVIEMLHNNPVVTVPIVLKRLKSKEEEWKAAQREWQRVWRDQTAKVFWKSLDHQGITVKANDKKAFSTKALVNDIQAKYKSQDVRRQCSTTPIVEHQFMYTFKDFGIILDASRLLAVSLEHTNTFSANDREKIDYFIKSFIPLFFGMNSRDVEDTVNSIARKSPDDDGDEGSPAAGESSTRAGRRGRQDDLLKDVLKRGTGKNGKGSRKDKEGSVASRGSKESTPEVNQNDSDIEMALDGPPDRPIKEEQHWISRPTKHLPDMKPGTPVSHGDESSLPVKRTLFTLYANTTIYCFFRTFQILCKRLSDIKACEEEIRNDVTIRRQQKAAHDLHLLGSNSVPGSSKMEELFSDTSPNANYYSQVLDHCEKFIEAELDSNTFEEGLRSVYVQKGWQLYTIDKLLLAILRFIQVIVPNDTKEKSSDKGGNADIIRLFKCDRERREFTKERGEYQELISYRRSIEKMLAPEDSVYRIDWNEENKEATIRYVPRNEMTIANELDKDERWNYYIQTYMMCAPTEGIPLGRCAKVFLTRNRPSEDDLPEDGSPREMIGSSVADGFCNEENMEIRICVNTYRLFFAPNTEDFMVQRRSQRLAGESKMRAVSGKRINKWHDFLNNAPWMQMQNMSQEEIERKKAEWEVAKKNGQPTDVVMGGV
ncbi:unnamed protein product [Tuber aestivum]|uniref:Histone deacetylase interacting domain-containing protein n=1 Tax=Tuber aestivum TaxID=59557 RepID=A0A292PX40_9PEZI|nr:unnamed protein product [Tuber aestivum]